MILPQPGETFGPYRLEAKLGQGTSGLVFRAFDPRLHRQVALKLVHPTLLHDASARDRFWREGRVLAQLAHPYLVTVHEVGTAVGWPYLAMRLCDGQTLARRIEHDRSAGHSSVVVTGGATPQDSRAAALLATFEKLALALQHAHDAGVVHRDVKPANIIFDAIGEPVLIDFGLARPLAAGAASLTAAGTPRYQPPELVRNPRLVPGPGLDVYALAATLYEACTLQPAFGAASAHELSDAILHRSPPPLRARTRGLPRDLEAVLQKAMEKDPAHRYGSAREFADDLQRLRLRQPVRARRTPAHRRAALWTRQHPLVATLLAFVVLAAATAGVVSERVTLARDAADLLATRALLDVAARSASELGPAWPGNLSAIDAWLARFDGDDGLGVRFQRVCAELRRLAGLAPAPGNEPEPALLQELQQELRDYQRIRAQAAAQQASLWSLYLAHAPDDVQARIVRAREDFDRERELGVPGAAASQRQALLLDLLRDLRDALVPFGLIDHVRRQRALAAAAARSLEECAGVWARTRAQVSADPRLPGLDLVPQPGLVPLGPDPRSGLQEFAVLGTGSLPVREAGTGELRYGDDAAIVLVLVPGGTSRVGDDGGMSYRHPLHEVTLAPFFLGKHELTQAQWQEMAGDDPSSQRPGVGMLRKTTLRHPVDLVAPERAGRVLAWFGLVFPTEAQWEHGARPGVDDAPDLGGGNQSGPQDGFLGTAPVGSFASNAWGLFDLQGNVAEICRDRAPPYQTAPHRHGDGLLLNTWRGALTIEVCSVRGGNMVYDTGFFVRNSTKPWLPMPGQGIRAARALLRPDPARVGSGG